MSYGSSCKDAGTNVRVVDRLPSNYSTSSEHRKSSFFVRVAGFHLLSRRFPRERRTPESQVLPSAPSTWSLTEVRTDEDTEPNPDPSIQRSEDLPVVQEGHALPQTQSNLSWSGQLMRKVKEAVKRRSPFRAPSSQLGK